jgi:hypothetical protein
MLPHARYLVSPSLESPNSHSSESRKDLVPLPTTKKRFAGIDVIVLPVFLFLNLGVLLQWRICDHLRGKRQYHMRLIAPRSFL